MSEIGKNLPEISRTDMQPPIAASQEKREIKLSLPEGPSKPLELSGEQLDQIKNLSEPKNPINAALIGNAQGAKPPGLERAVGELAARILGG